MKNQMRFDSRKIVSGKTRVIHFNAIVLKSHYIIRLSDQDRDLAKILNSLKEKSQIA